MAGKWFYSKTRWRTQKRDRMGRWTSGGVAGVKAKVASKASNSKAGKNVNAKYNAATEKMWRSDTKGAKVTRRAVTNAAVFANDHVQAGFNPYKTSGHVTVSGGKRLKVLPTHRLNVSLTVSVDPIGKSIFEKKAEHLGNQAAALAGHALKSKTAHDAVQVGLGNARAIKVLGTQLNATGNRKKRGVSLRTSTPKQRARQMRRDQREHARKERSIQRNLTTDQRNGVPSTISGAKGAAKGRAQRRNKAGQPSTPTRTKAAKNSIHNELRTERAANRLRGGVSPSRVVGGTTKKTKKKSGGTYTK